MIDLSSVIRIAARLVRYPDDMPAEEVKLRCLAANTMRKMQVEIARLQAIVEKLPKDADGNPVVSNIDTLWFAQKDGTVIDSERIVWTQFHWVTGVDENQWWACCGESDWRLVENGYKAAEAARDRGRGV